MRTKNLYFENLDGLRFICFLLVFLYHSFNTEISSLGDSSVHRFVTQFLFANGNLGVNIFFVLSGFLITFLLIQEKKLRGQIDIKKFWMRRILRIWPLFYLCVLFGFFCFPLLKSLFGEQSTEQASISCYLIFLNNFNFIKVIPDATSLAVLWSVAVEEQFYLVWPVVLFLLPLKKYWIAFSAVMVICIVFRALQDRPIIHEFHTLSCIGDMTVGAFGAWLVVEKDSFRERIGNLNKTEITILYIIFLIIFLFRGPLFYSTYIMRIVERPLIAVVLLFLILEQNYARNSFFKFSNFKAISKLGVITYGLYCLHLIAIVSVQTVTQVFGLNTNLWEVMLLEPTLALLLSILMAYLSFNFYERPFLKLKGKFTYISRVSPMKIIASK
ncbi:acyltransferase family protein [Mangrovibacterium diazotrophicum]|uniref:Peptidoglycan/LPS O-acetylase OafA/YrhL n=1 Tax=Mangrovibacterium diazotrophicum TaxID=1261403 RepID=A0A419VWP2_9BACT|nr:acyltransferase [Mangrovibacterium diazotrophicum]RKD86521.1 peptidoglycan/LPS O-acetylase OafA/YrhL [Mangrovibacterium diazotrophicum]